MKWVGLEPLVSNICEMLTYLFFNCIMMQTILSKGDSNELWYQVMQPTPNVSTRQCVPFWKRMEPMITVEWTLARYFLCLLDERALKHQVLPFWLTRSGTKSQQFHIHRFLERQSLAPSFIRWLCGFIRQDANGDDKIHASQHREAAFCVDHDQQDRCDHAFMVGDIIAYTIKCVKGKARLELNM